MDPGSGDETKYCVQNLAIGKRESAARSIENVMQVKKQDLIRLEYNEVKGIVQEVEKFATSAESENNKEERMDVLRWLHYILSEETSEKKFANGIRDEGRGKKKLSYFVGHQIAKSAELTEAEVVALRLYTTPVYKFMNNPLREEKKCPLAVTTYFAYEGIKKLRKQAAQEKEPIVLWRGLRNVKMTNDFKKGGQGGTELAFMSTTRDLAVAIKYSLSQESLILKIVPKNFMAMGADLAWLSVFPKEAEVLFPPLTYLQPTGRTKVVEVRSKKLSFTILEVEPSF